MLVVVFLLFTSDACSPGTLTHRAPRATIPDRPWKTYFEPPNSCTFLLLVLMKKNLKVFLVLKDNQFGIVYHVVSHTPSLLPSTPRAPTSQ